MLKTSFIVIIILKLCIKFKCWKPVFLCGLEETKSSKFLWRKKTPAPFNHSPHQHPSITHLSSTLQSLTSPAPFNPLRFIWIDIAQTTMSVSTLYLFPFSSYMQKTIHDLGLFTKWDPFPQLKPTRLGRTGHTGSSLDSSTQT